MNTFLCFFLAAAGTFSASSNFSVDLTGQVDTRPSTWGTAAAQTWAVKFVAPTGYRVRILRLRGDLVAWPRVLPGEPPIAAGSYAGVLLGFQTSAADGSGRCIPCADNTMLYLQGAMSDRPSRVPFSENVRTGGLLGTDGILVVKVASWLNTTGRAIHVEPTFTVEYRWEKEQSQ